MKKNYLILLAFFVLFLLGIFLLKNQRGLILKKTKVTPSKIQVQPTKEKGRLFFEPNLENFYLVGENLEIKIMADSAGEIISGYDVILNYDSKRLKFENAISFIGDFEILSKLSRNQLWITGVLKLEAKLDKVFYSQPILILQFKTLKTGKVPVKIYYYKQGYLKDSNLMNNQTQDVLGKGDETELFIGEKLKLFKNNPLSLESKINLELKEVNLRSINCAQCLSEAKLEMRKDKETKELIIKTNENNQNKEQFNQFGYLFKPKSLGENFIELIYLKDY